MNIEPMYAQRRTVIDEIKVPLNIGDKPAFKHFSGEETKYTSEGVCFFCLPLSKSSIDEIEKHSIKYFKNNDIMFAKIYVEEYASIYLDGHLLDINSWEDLDTMNLRVEEMEAHFRTVNLEGKSIRYIHTDIIYFVSET